MSQQGEITPSDATTIPASEPIAPVVTPDIGASPQVQPQEGGPLQGGQPQTAEDLQAELDKTRQELQDKEDWSRRLQSERDRLLNHINDQQFPQQASQPQAQVEPEMTADQWVQAMSSEDSSERERAFRGLQQSAKDLALQEFQQQIQAQQWEIDRKEVLGDISAEEQYLAELAINEDMAQGYFTHPADAYLRAKAGSRERLSQLVELGLRAEQTLEPNTPQRQQLIPPQQTPQFRPVVPQVPGMPQRVAPISNNGGQVRPTLNSLWNIRS